MISKEILNTLLVKYDYENLTKVYAAVLENNPQLPFPQKDFEMMRTNLSVTQEYSKEYDNYVQLLRLRIRRGTDQIEDYADPFIFQYLTIVFDKFHSNSGYQDPIIQQCIAQAMVHFSFYEYCFGRYFIFLWCVAHLKISEGEYIIVCEKFFDILEKASAKTIASCCLFYQMFSISIQDRFPSLAGAAFKEMIDRRTVTKIDPTIIAKCAGDSTYRLLLAEDISGYSLERSQDYLLRLMTNWISSRLKNNDDFSMKMVKAHQNYQHLLGQFSQSEHWETLYAQMVEGLIATTLSFHEQALKHRNLHYLPEYLIIFETVSLLLRFKGVSENKLISWHNKLINGLRAKACDSTNKYIKHSGYLNCFDDPIRCTLESLSFDNSRDFDTNYKISVYPIQKPNILEGIQVQGFGLPLGLQMYLSFTQECEPDILIKAYEAFEPKDLLHTNANNLFYLLLIMGTDTFQVLNIIKKVNSHEELTKVLKQACLRGKYAKQLKAIFQNNRAAILSEGKWVIFLKILTSISNGIRCDSISLPKDLEDCYFYLCLRTSQGRVIVVQDQVNPTLPEQSLLRFRARFLKVNAQVQNAEQNGRDLFDFIRKYSNEIISLVNLYGVDTFEILNHYLTTSVMPLERLLENLPREIVNETAVMPLLQQLYGKYRNTVIKNKQQEVFFISSSLIAAMRSSWLEIDPIVLIDQTSSLNELNEVISQKMISKFLEGIGRSDEHYHYKDVFQRVPIALFAQLVKIREDLSNQIAAYLPIFDTSVCADLLGKNLVNKKATDLIKQLDAHNQNIRAQLKGANIDIDKAFNYKEIHEFSCGGFDGGVDELQTIKALWIDMNQLIANAQRLNQTGIVKLIDELQNALLKKSEKAQGAALTDNQAKEVFRKLRTISIEQKKSRLDTLVAKLERHIVASNDKALNEFYGHLKREVTTLNPLLLQSDQAKHYIPRKYFSIEMFDKSQPDTYALGSYVGCCLAPNGMRFNAMIQRRMDDAMFMHVVRDKATNKPVALNWLYFAKSQSNPQEIYVVANFFEITASLGLVPGYRDAMILELKEFTGRYTQAIGAKAFIMNQLSYGLIPDFTGYQQTPLLIEKVGGFLKLNGRSEDYYLKSLCSEKFHLFAPRATQHVLSLSSSSVVESLSNNTTVSNLTI